MTTSIRRHNLFPIPVFEVPRVLEFSEHQQGLIDLALTLRSTEASAEHSNQQGFHSGGQLHRLGNPHIEWLVSHLHDAIDNIESGIDAPRPPGRPRIGALWANVHERGGYNVPHMHAPLLWSGAFYVLAEGSVEKDDPHDYAGLISFFSPAPHGVPNGVPTQTTFRPVDGVGFIFPGWLLHAVYPHRSEHLRISYAFNLGISAG